MGVYKQLLKQLGLAISFIIALFMLCYLLFAPNYFYIPYAFPSVMFPPTPPSPIEYFTSLTPLQHFEKFLLYSRDFLTFDFVHLGYQDIIPFTVERIQNAMLLTYVQLIIATVVFVNFLILWIGAKRILKDIFSSRNFVVVVKRGVGFSLLLVLVCCWLWFFFSVLTPVYFGVIAWNTENPLSEYGAGGFNEPLFRVNMLAIVLGFILIGGVYFFVRNMRTGTDSRQPVSEKSEEMISDTLSLFYARIAAFSGLFISSLFLLDYIFIGHGVGRLFLRSLRFWEFFSANLILLYLGITVILISVTLKIGYGLVKFGPYDFQFLKSHYWRLFRYESELVSEGIVAP